MNKLTIHKILFLLLFFSFISPATLLAHKAAVTAENSLAVNSQQNKREITGTVKDKQGEPMIGVSVVVNGTTNGTITDLDGNFKISVPATGAALKFTYIGYLPVTLAVDKAKSFDIVMEENAQQLGEVVVTAMGIERKEKSLTYATQKVGGDDLTKVQDVNFVNSLDGRISGVTITPSAGGAGGASKILLRGNKSILGNNTPLVVVDGIPMTNNVNSQKGWDAGSNLNYANVSEGSDPLSLVNPDDIESINVLKGANAAALYGSAAANGVVMITTKKGKEGKIDVNITSNVTFEKPLLTPKIQNVYGAGVNLVANTIDVDSWGKKITDQTPEELAYKGAHLRNYANDDVADFFGTGVTFNNSVSVSGGSEKVRSYFSYANSHADGMRPNNTYNRNSLSFRQNYALFNKKLNIDVSLNYTHAVTRNRPGGGTALNPIYDLYTVPRNIDMDYYKNNYMIDNGQWTSNQEYYHYVKGDKGQWIWQSDKVDLQGKQQQWAFPSKGQNNPYWLTNEANGRSEEERAHGYISAKYELIKGLTIQGRLSMDRTRFKSTTKRSATTWNPSVMEDYGVFGQDLITTNEVYVDYLLSYNREIKDFSVSATAGWVGHTIENYGQNIWTPATTFDPNRRILPTLINFFDPTASGGNPTERTSSNNPNWDKAALFTGQVGYKDMIYIDGSYRRDWYRAFKQFSSRGVPDNYGYFGFGASAIFSSIFELPEVITNLKLRTSYSEVGNSIPNILFNKATENSLTGSVTIPAYGYFDNPVPEKTKSFEAGFDISLFGNAVDMDFTYYNSAMHNSYLLNSSGGGKSIPVNTGVIRNQGIETTVGYSLNIAKDFMWRTSVNFSFNKNKIEKTYHKPDGSEVLIEQKIANDKIQVKYSEGGQYGDMYATDFKRDADGNIVLSSTGAPVLSDEKFGLYIGNMNAKYHLGWSNTFTYKNFALFFLINGKIGGKVISFTEAELDRLGVSQRTADARLAAEADPSLVWNGKPALVMPDGNLAPIKEYYQTIGGDVNATQYVYDATNFRLRELSLGYTFLNLLGMGKNVTVSAIGRNLFFLYKKAPVDPDISLSTQNGLGAFEIFNMPSARSFGFSVKVNF
ncbi:SusC/RagA family TonB-linked outer membrane protein [Coprobacter tertius]|uniref:SusC/RagA family TonB-linked outer membrane protein n=1 Tax=Coprobacter tertius TaxID=2944915 RepID=A0ABT1MIZ8_9BACT|nr:SusC/RagA family TonB-linked outer membrane protein [Coprobacter tertius]MCP9611678.1 SusC/RagA family TonB-linked outer membrane protein [Coprobacter tertius]